MKKDGDTEGFAPDILWSDVIAGIQYTVLCHEE
jgi:hypothetical protein